MTHNRRDVFSAGASLYGVADAELLAAHTHKFESRWGGRGRRALALSTSHPDYSAANQCQNANEVEPLLGVRSTQ